MILPGMFSHGFNWRGCVTPSNPIGFTGENLLAGVVACNVPYHHGGSGIFTSLNPGRESAWGWDPDQVASKKIGENTFFWVGKVGRKTKWDFENFKGHTTATLQNSFQNLLLSSSTKSNQRSWNRNVCTRRVWPVCWDHATASQLVRRFINTLSEPSWSFFSAGKSYKKIPRCSCSKDS